MILCSATQLKEYTEKGWWGSETFWDVFVRNAERTPAALALVDPANRGEVTDGPAARLSYAELRERAERLAGVLLAQGLGKDTIVAALLPNTAEAALLYLAASAIGAVICPLPLEREPAELAALLAQVQAQYLITASRIGQRRPAEQLAQLRAGLPALEQILAFGERVPAGVIALEPLLAGAASPPAQSAAADAPVSANDLITIGWTAGSTGAPKAVPHSCNEWWVAAMATLDAAELREGAVLLNPLPLTGAAGIGGMLGSWLLTGGTLVQHHPLGLAELVGQLAAERAEFTIMAPAQLEALLASPELLASADLSALRAIGVAAGALAPALVQGWHDRYGSALITSFCSCEGLTIFSSQRDVPAPATRAALFPRFGRADFRWSNRVAAWMQTKLVGSNGREILAAGQQGELCVRGPAIFAGYYGAPELSELAFDADGYYRTGDLFEICDEGGEAHFYRFVGRLNGEATQ